MSYQVMKWAGEQTVGSPTRKAVLLALANDANHTTGLCCPDYPTIARETELSEKTVERATAKLVEDGFLKRNRKRRADGTLSRYFYTFPIQGTETTQPLDSPSFNHQTESRDKNQEQDQDQDQPSPASPSKEERDNVWNALEAVFGKPTTPQHRKRFGKVQRELLADSSLAAAAVAAEVPLRASRYRAKWPDCELTLEALAKHWPDLRGARAVGAGGTAPAWAVLDSGGVPVELLSVEDYREWRRSASPMENATYQQRFDVADDGLPA